MELLRRYWNRDDLLKPLVNILKRISEGSPADQEDTPPVSADEPTPRAWHVSDRLSPSDVKAWSRPTLLAAPAESFAEQYDIGTSSVKRLLREHGARKQRPRSAA